MKFFTTFDSNTKKLEKKHSVAEILDFVLHKPLQDHTPEEILVSYSLWILNFYKRDIKINPLDKEDIIEFIQNNTLSEVRKLGFDVTEKMFERHIKETLRSRLYLEERPYRIMALLNSTQQATETIQRMMRH